MKPSVPSVKTSRQEIPVLSPDPAQGLTSQQAAQRAAGGWKNTPADSPLRREREIIAENCLTFFNFVFVILALALLLSGSSVKNMAFLLVVVINTVIGCVQEIRAKRSVEKLTLVAEQILPVVRDGQILSLRSQELVRDDIVLFAPGDQICADAVVRTGQLQVNESLITGEADPIVKNPGDTLLSGSFVVTGRSRAQLTRISHDAYAAKLALEAKADPHAAKSEMMRSLDKLIRVVGFLLIPIGIALFCQEFFALHRGLTDSAEATVAALVGMIPEGLYLLTSVAMAVSTLKLTRQRVLVQDMNCIETLARVDVLCVDKTGTITEPTMEVEHIQPLTDTPPEQLEQIVTALFGDTQPDNDTAAAIREMFPGNSGWECTQRIPFSSQTKWSGGIFQDHGAYVAGAPEMLLGSRYGEIEATAEPWISDGYRVVLVAACNGTLQPAHLQEDQLVPLALILLTNRIRPEAPQTFRYFAQQGVAIKVISGDNPKTVSDVARRAGIEHAENWVDAQTLVTEEDYLQALENCTVFGRVTPEQKKQLIKHLRQQGHTVAMTGDGVNDVLALKEANCAIAMAQGAQAASQIAQLVLLDSDFSAIPHIVGEGRRVINNIQRAATLFLVKNIFSFTLALLSLLTAWPYPMVPLHLSMISALTIGVPSFFLAMEPNYERVTGHFLRGVLRRAFPGGLTNVFVVLMAQAFMFLFPITQEQTSTICASLLSVVGLLVLFQVCKPFDKFRKIIWLSMAAGLVLCFTALRTYLDLSTGDAPALLVMATLVIMTPTVFFAVQRLFDWGEKIYIRAKGDTHGNL